MKIQPVSFDSLWCPVFLSSYINCVFPTCCSPPGICWLCRRLAGFMSPPTGGVWTCSCSLASGSCFTNSSFLSCSTTFFWRKDQPRLSTLYNNVRIFVTEMSFYSSQTCIPDRVTVIIWEKKNQIKSLAKFTGVFML